MLKDKKIIYRKKRENPPKKVASKSNINRTLLGIVFILVGFAWFILIFGTSGVQSQKEDAAKEPIVADEAFEKKTNESVVRNIIIPRLNIDLSITPSKIKNGYWEVSETTASHGEGSANPGEGGNVVVFANDQWYKYKVSETVDVYPSDITTVAPTDSEVLTLFTCSGFFDEKRLIVKAIP